MNSIDGELTNPLQGFFTGITFLVLGNILVALLAGTVERLYGQVVTYNVFQRANEIFNSEKCWSYEERSAHIAYLNKAICNPFKNEIIEIENEDEKIEKLEKELNKQKDVLNEIKRILEKTVRIF